MHPLAWWGWASGVAVATTRTTDPLVIALLVAATVLVVLVHREDTPWARAFRGYLVLAGCIVLARAVFHVLVGLKVPGTVLLDLPTVPLGDWAVGVQLLGPVTVEGLLAAVLSGMRLAALVVAAGAANALADPRRALRCLPAALHQLGTAVVIAVSVTPQLVQSAAQVRRAQRLRGEPPRGARALPALMVPVLTDALDRSLTLAASMDSRGYARAVPGSSDAAVGTLLLGSLVAAALGTYGLLDGTTSPWLGLPVLAVGAAAAVVGGTLAGRRVRRTRYRPEPWRLRDTVVAGCGLVAALALVVVGAVDPAGVSAGQDPLVWPTPSLWAVGAALVAAVPALVPQVTR